MTRLPCCLGDLADVLELHPLVLFEHRLVDPDVVPPGLRDADRAVGLVDDRFLVQLGADFRVGVGRSFSSSDVEQDRVPGRQAAEDLRVLHREVLRHPVRAAHRIGADAHRRGLLDARHVLLPLVRTAHRLRQVVVDDGAAGRLGEARHHAVLQLGVLAAAGLDHAGAHLAQHVGEREDLLLVGPQRRDVHALRIEMALLARHAKAERAGLHAVAHDVLHLP